MSDMTITKLTKHIGAEVSGIDLGRPLSGGEENAVYDALIDHCVIFSETRISTPHTILPLPADLVKLTSRILSTRMLRE